MSRYGPLGEFEQAVLLAIVHLDEGAYGAAIRKEIEKRTRRNISVGALYTALDRLEAKGFVTSALADPTPERGGRAKRHFTPTSAGTGALRESREFLSRMWGGLVLDPKRHRG